MVDLPEVRRLLVGQKTLDKGRSIAFGTVLTMLLVPVLYIVLLDTYNTALMSTAIILPEAGYGART